jgi:hypothetical protein
MIEKRKVGRPTQNKQAEAIYLRPSVHSKLMELKERTGMKKSVLVERLLELCFKTDLDNEIM